MINHSVIQGRLTVTPELRHTPSDTAVTQFSIAVDRPYSKDKEKKTDFINCVAWRKTAEFICKYFSKGSLLVLEGRIQVRNYEDKNKNKHTAVEVVVSEAHFCGDRVHTATNTDASGDTDEGFEVIQDDEDMPF